MFVYFVQFTDGRLFALNFAVIFEKHSGFTFSRMLSSFEFCIFIVLTLNKTLLLYMFYGFCLCVKDRPNRK